MSIINHNYRFPKSIFKLIVIVFLLLSTGLTSQNLVKNGSFEFYVDSLLNYSKDNMGGLDGIVKYESWPSTQLIGSVIPPWFCIGTADYFNDNSLFTKTGYNNGWYTYDTFGIPENWFGYSFAKDSNYYAGFLYYTSPNPVGYADSKEYIYQQLDAPLQSNETYCLSFWVKLASGANRAVNQIGALFTNSVPATTSPFFINAQPQVQYNGTFITDTLNWTQVQGCFTAEGGEQFITIGNFNTNANTNTFNVGNKTHYMLCCDPTAYYYIDDVSLVKYDIATNINDVNVDYLDIKIYPNPTKGILFIKAIDKNIIVSIKDIVGKEVLKTKNHKEIDVSILEKGIYFVDVYQGTQKIITKKIIKD